MGASCCAKMPVNEPVDNKYRRVLWLALAINATMFVIEIVAGVRAKSVSLQADGLDFLADSANYAISLFVVGMSLYVRSRAALLKGVSMALLGLWVVGSTGWNMLHHTLPQAETMGIVGVAAIVANGIVLAMLWAYRYGDSNMRSVWLCSRNDVISNFAVILAALGVFGTQTGWPDIAVAAIMAILSLQGAWQIIRLSLEEMSTAKPLKIPVVG